MPARLVSNMSISGAVEAVIRNRLVRILLALALIAVGAWAFLPHLAYRIAPLRLSIQSSFGSPRRSPGICRPISRAEVKSLTAR